MKETSWVKDILQPSIQKIVSAMGDESLQVLTRKKLPYAGCVTRYEKNNKPSELEMQSYETDILITETFSNLSWCPRVLIETKLETITTHDAISFGQKACTHKNIHPYRPLNLLMCPDISRDFFEIAKSKVAPCRNTPLSTPDWIGEKEGVFLWKKETIYI